MVLSTDWIILLVVVLVVVTTHVLSRNYRTVLRRQKSRKIAEKAAAAAEPFTRAEKVEVDATAVSGLRQDELEQLTDQFAQLGFVRVRDYALRLPGHETTNSFARHMVNPELKCFAEIMATQKTLNEGGPLLLGLSSFLEDDWSISSSSRRVSKADYLRRISRGLNQFLPGATPAELLRSHIELCGRVTRELGIHILDDLSTEFFNMKVKQRLEKKRSVLLGCDILAELPKANQITTQSTWEWLGDYPEQAAGRIEGRKLRPLTELAPTYRVPQEDATQQMTLGNENVVSHKQDGGEDS